MNSEVLTREKNDVKLKENFLVPGIPAKMRICLYCLMACRLQAGSCLAGEIIIRPGVKTPKPVMKNNDQINDF
jgi:hypothetical protein